MADKSARRFAEAGMALLLLMLSLMPGSRGGSGSGGQARAQQRSSALYVAYPGNGSTIDSPSTFIIGAAPPGVPVTCNAQPVRVNSAGFFAHVVKLNRGSNAFQLVSAAESTTITVKRPPAPSAMPPTVFGFKQDSLEPFENMGVVAGDVIAFSAQATPQAKVSVKLGARTIPLYSLAQRPKNSPLSAGIDTAFGVARARGSAPDVYSGYYKVAADDSFSSVKPVFSLTKDNRTVSQTAAGAITVVRQPAVLHTRQDDTVVRVGPGAARSTPWVEGVRVASDGFRGGWRRLEVAPGRHFWTASQDLAFEAPGSPLPESRVTTVNLLSDSYGAVVAVPLTQRLPYQVEQDIKSGTLLLRIFGATADTDFITPDLTGDGHILPRDRLSAKLVDFVTFKQKSDGIYELSVHLKGKVQWGYFVDYNNATLQLHVKAPPAIDASGGLGGISLCVDAGHGGKEPGAAGCDGTKEAAVNLAIALKLQSELERLGAKVVMTRTSDVDVSLADRVRIAVDNNCDFLVSVHNNSLPDGRDPWKEHGTSTYWYHPQSIEPARILKDNLVRDSGFPDFGTRYQNLFVCRPSRMPAVLVEVGFMIHPDEFLQLTKPEFQSKVAASMAESLRCYIAERAGRQAY